MVLPDKTTAIVGHDLMEQQTHIAKVVFGKQYEAISRRCAPQLPYQVGDFVFDLESENPHWLILNDPNREALQTTVPRQRRMLIVGEPSPLCHWPVDYINQFGLLLSPYAISGFEGQWIQSHPALPWIVGWNREADTVLPLDELEALPVPEKLDAVSVVVSRKVVHAGHRDRLQFLDKLKSRLGDRLQIFGRGIREVDDKLDAILPYKYHLALENTIEDNYWTEKLSDAFLGHALPLYSGCPNINQWFSDDMLVRLDLTDHNRTVDQIESILKRNAYADFASGIGTARQRVIQDESLFQVVARTLQQQALKIASPAKLPAQIETETIAPISKPRLAKRFQREARRIFHQATTSIPKVA